MFAKGLKDGIAIALGYFSVSFTFGLMAVNEGLAVWQAVAISMFCVTSAGQFAGVGIMTAGGAYYELVLSQIMINLRYSLMSIALSQKADESMTVPARFFVGFGVTDEIFAVAMARNKTVGRIYMAGLILLPYMGWSLGTLCGALIGSVIPRILSMSMGVAIYAMFLAIIIPPAKKERGVLVVVILAAFLGCVMEYIPLKIGSGFRIILVGVLASLAGAFLFPIEEEEGL